MPKVVFPKEQRLFLAAEHPSWHVPKLGSTKREVLVEIGERFFSTFESLQSDGYDGGWPDRLKQKRLDVSQISILSERNLNLL
jgi:hypothetical protein